MARSTRPVGLRDAFDRLRHFARPVHVRRRRTQGLRQLLARMAERPIAPSRRSRCDTAAVTGMPAAHGSTAADGDRTDRHGGKYADRYRSSYVLIIAPAMLEDGQGWSLLFRAKTPETG
ncbi:MAG: hypothetical protein M0002_01625 [Rhodospirillales bacterium]|nr:hypothetical protein [Rhodospirillales bacterium]